MTQATTTTRSNSTEVPERLSVPFAEQTPAATTNRLAYEAKADATVERITVRIYRGAETTVRIRPLIVSQDGEQERPMLQFEGKQYVDGDNDMFEFALSESVERGEEIVVEAENTDGSNAHNWRTTVDVDYRGGLESILDGVVR